MGIDISIRFEDIKRESNNNVSGKVTLKLTGQALGQDIDLSLDSRSFNFPQDGEQEVYNQSVGVGVLTVKVTASVYEEPAGQCCIRGHVHVDAPVGGGIGKDLDANCTTIP